MALPVVALFFLRSLAGRCPVFADGGSWIVSQKLPTPVAEDGDTSGFLWEANKERHAACALKIDQVKPAPPSAYGGSGHRFQLNRGEDLVGAARQGRALDGLAPRRGPRRLGVA